MAGKKGHNLLLLYDLTKVLVALPGVFCFFLFFCFIMGNFQGFQDSTQAVILTVLGVCSIMFALISSLGIIEAVLLFFIKDSISLKNKIFFFIVMIVCLVFALSFLSFSLVLGVLTEGL